MCRLQFVSIWTSLKICLLVMSQNLKKKSKCVAFYEAHRHLAYSRYKSRLITIRISTVFTPLYLMVVEFIGL